MGLDADTLKARLNLFLLIPVLEDIVAGDSAAATLCRGWNSTIQIQAGAEGALAVQLKFAGGKLSVEPGRAQNPTIIIDFGSARNLNANFGAGGEKQTPKFLRGRIHFIMLIKTAKLLTFIKRYLKPRDVDSLPDDAKALCAQALLRVGVLGVPAIAENDDSAAPMVKNIPDGVCQWRILPDGVPLYVTVKQGVVTGGIGEIANPSAKVEFKDAASALAVSMGKIDPMKALMGGALSISGQTQIAMMLTPLQQKVGKALR